MYGIGSRKLEPQRATRQAARSQNHWNTKRCLILSEKSQSKSTVKLWRLAVCIKNFRCIDNVWCVVYKVCLLKHNLYFNPSRLWQRLRALGLNEPWISYQKQFFSTIFNHKFLSFLIINVWKTVIILYLWSKMQFLILKFNMSCCAHFLLKNNGLL